MNRVRVAPADRRGGAWMTVREAIRDTRASLEDCACEAENADRQYYCRRWRRR